MSNAKVEDHGSYEIMELLISKIGKLGIEFRSTSSPYFVINVTPEAQQLYGVQPGDLLLSVRKDTDADWTDTEGLTWPSLVDILKYRPSFARFKRFNLAKSTRAATSPQSELSPRQDTDAVTSAGLSVTMQPPVLPSIPTPSKDISPKSLEPIKNPFPGTNATPKSVTHSDSRVAPQVMAAIPRTPRSDASPLAGSQTPSGRRSSISQQVTTVSVVYTEEGPLGLEFEDMHFPFRVGGVRSGSMSTEKGIKKGDCLISVNGKPTKSMSWDAIRSELSIRPSTVIFERDPNASGQSQSIWDVAAGLMRVATPSEGDNPTEELRKERDELRQIVATIGGEDLGTLRQIAKDYETTKAALSNVETQITKLEKDRESTASVLEEERAKNLKLVEVIDEIEKSQSSVIERFEKEIQERERIIADLRKSRDRSSSNHGSSDQSSSTVEALKEVLRQTEAKLELMEKDNTRLRKENTELGTMVQKCLEKIQRDLSDKPHWVDRRVVCSALGTLLKDLETIDENNEKATDMHLSARQKIGDVLGLTYEERSSVGLLSVPTRLVDEDGSPSRGPSISEDFVSFLEREATVQNV